MVKIFFSFSPLKRGCCHLFRASAAPRLAPFISFILLIFHHKLLHPRSLNSEDLPVLLYLSRKSLSSVSILLIPGQTFSEHHSRFFWLFSLLFFVFIICMDSHKYFSSKFKFVFTFSLPYWEFILLWSILIIYLSPPSPDIHEHSYMHRVQINTFSVCLLCILTLSV